MDGNSLDIMILLSIPRVSAFRIGVSYHFVVADGGETSEHQVDIDDGWSLCKKNVRNVL